MVLSGYGAAGQDGAHVAFGGYGAGEVVILEVVVTVAVLIVLVEKALVVVMVMMCYQLSRC